MASTNVSYWRNLSFVDLSNECVANIVVLLSEVVFQLQRNVLGLISIALGIVEVVEITGSVGVTNRLSLFKPEMRKPLIPKEGVAGSSLCVRHFLHPSGL